MPRAASASGMPSTPALSHNVSATFTASSYSLRNVAISPTPASVCSSTCSRPTRMCGRRERAAVWSPDSDRDTVSTSRTISSLCTPRSMTMRSMPACCTRRMSSPIVDAAGADLRQEDLVRHGDLAVLVAALLLVRDLILDLQGARTSLDHLFCEHIGS